MAKKNVFQKSKKKVNIGALKKGAMATCVGAALLFSGVGLVGCSGSDIDGTNWFAGTDSPLEAQGTVGDFYYDTDDYKIYQKGENGWTLVSTIKSSVSINSDGYWVIDGTTTQIKAVAPEVTISNGYWVINGTTTSHKALGVDGATPEIVDGHWWINGQNTNIKALAEDGKSAYELAYEQDNTIGTEAEWIESLKGSNGYTPYIENGEWYINGNPTGVVAKGESGKSAYQIAYELDNTIGTEAEWILSLKAKDAATWLTGHGAPTTAGKLGDLYLDLDSCDVYVMGAENWSNSANIEGDDAPRVTSIEKEVDASNKWGMYYKYKITLEDKTSVYSETVKEVLDNHYYTATEKGDIEKLIKEGVKYIRLGNNVALADNDDEVSSSHTLRLTNDLHVDLNGFVLTSNNRIVFTGANISFTDGDLEFTLDRWDLSAIQVQGSSRLSINDVEFNANVGSAILALNSVVEINDSTVTGDVYAVNTNAGSVDFYDADITIKDSVISTVGGNEYDNTAILFNVPGKLNIVDSEVTGDRQALIVRGGDAVIKNSKVTLTGVWYEKQDSAVADYYDDESHEWGSGNNVPNATIVLGNHNTGAYQYSASLTLENADVVANNQIDIANIYAIGNETPAGSEYIGVTFTVNNENLSVIDLYFTRAEYSNVKMNILISNKETLDEVVKFVNMMAMEEVPAEAIISVLNPTLTKDIIIIENEMSYKQLDVYNQANNFVTSENSKYGVYATALAIVVSNGEELVQALDHGPVKLAGNIALETNETTVNMINSALRYGYIDMNGYELNLSVKAEAIVNENLDTQLDASLAEIQEKLYNKIPNTNGGEAQYYTLAELAENNIEMNNFYVDYAALSGINEFVGIGANGTDFIDDGNGFEPVAISIGNNVFVNVEPVKYQDGQLSVASVILATEIASSYQIVIYYKGETGEQKELCIINDNNQIESLTLTPTSENEIQIIEDGYIAIKGTNTTTPIIFNYANNDNTRNDVIAVTKKVWIDVSSGYDEIVSVSYGFALTDEAVADTNTYTLGLYPIYGVDLTNEENITKYNSRVLSYTAYIKGEGLIRTGIGFNLTSQEAPEGESGE